MENVLVNRREMEPHEWAVDIALGAGVFILGCVQLVFGGGSLLPIDDAFRAFTGIQRYVFSIVPFFYLAVMSLALMVRRLTPWGVLVVVFCTYLMGRYQMGGQELSVFAPCLAVFTVAEERGRWEVVVAGALVAIAALAMPTPGQSAAFDVYTHIQTLTYFGLALAAGISVHNYRRYKHEAEQRLAEAEYSREKEAERRVEAERVRIAREIHDITAHSLSAVSIQAAAAERIVDRDPHLAKEALRTIRDTSKGSLDEIRAMIGVLRGEGEAAESTPTHGTEHLGDLVRYLENAGIEVYCDQSRYRRDDIPLYLDVGVFGIAREAVTNIVKHAHARHTSITLHATADLVTLIVVDDGAGMGGSYANPPAETNATRHAAGGGHGLQGMAERANLLGGSFKAYDVEGGGFAVVVRIPYRKKESVPLDAATGVPQPEAAASTQWEDDPAETPAD